MRLLCSLTKSVPLRILFLHGSPFEVDHNNSVPHTLKVTNPLLSLATCGILKHQARTSSGRLGLTLKMSNANRPRNSDVVSIAAKARLVKSLVLC